MVKRFLNIFHHSINGLHEAAYVLASFALLSQVLALFRDRLLAHMFGAGAALDVYYAAFRIPDFLFVSLASLAGAYVLIPFLEEKVKEGKESARNFLSEIWTALFAGMAAVSFILFLAMPYLAEFVAPGFSGAEKDEFVILSRLFLLSPFLLGFSNLLGSVTQAGRRFFAFALSPVFYNLGIIAGIIFLAPSLGIRGAALGVILGATLHLAVQIPSAKAEGIFPQFARAHFREVWRVFSVSLPRTLALSASHFSLLVLVAIASLISQGSISIFQFSFNLQSVPLGIIGVSYSVAAFPTLARLWGEKDMKKFLEQVSISLRHIILWSLPAIVLFIVLRAQIVRVILGSGSFNWEHTRLTAAALALFIVSLLAQNIVLLLARGYYAAGKTKQVLAAGFASSLATILLGMWLYRLASENGAFLALLERLLKIEGIEGSIAVVLPLAWSAGLLFNAILLLSFFRRDFGTMGGGVARAFRENLAASIFLGITAYFSLNILDNVFDLDTFFGVFFQGALAGLLGLLVWGVFLFAIKNGEFMDALAALHKKFWKAKPIASEQEGL